jgi:YidC/Oxa1 family membrane protein insertase
MMDKRTLFAFVLAGVVLVAWSIFFPPGRPPAPNGGADSALVAASRTAEIRRPEDTGALDSRGMPMSADPRAAPSGGADDQVEAPDAASGEPVWEPAPVDSVWVETDLLRAHIHTHGGGLGMVELRRFPSGFEPGTMVDLVRPGLEALDVALAWGKPESRRMSLANAPFAVAREMGAETGDRFERITLVARRSDGLAITRRYTFREGSYEVGHEIEVSGLTGALESPELVVGWRAGIPYTEAERGSNEQYFASLVRVGDEVSNWGVGKFKSGPKQVDGAVRWVAVSNKYFLAALVPAPGTAVTAGADGDPSSFRSSVWLRMPAAEVASARASLKLFLGPKDLERVKAVDPGLGDAVSLGYRWMRPLSQLMLNILKATYRIIPNYGLVIIVLSVLIRVILFPLNQSSMRSMKAMQRVQPEMEALRKKYADRPQEMNKQLMLLYQKHKVNPLGGCLPIVVQMPVLFALYFSLMFAVDLRMAPFVSWIHDLSAPDTVAHVMGFPIHVLPIIMTIVSVLQARSTPTDPRQAMMTTLMPIFLLVFFYNMPSGLVLYWTVTNLGTWVQQVIVNRGEAARAEASAGAGVGPNAAGAPAAALAPGRKSE